MADLESSSLRYLNLLLSFIKIKNYLNLSRKQMVNTKTSMNVDQYAVYENKLTNENQCTMTDRFHNR